VLGAASAVLFAYNAALTKTVTTLLRDGGWAHVFASWEPYLLALSGASGLYLLQSALHAAPHVARRSGREEIHPDREEYDSEEYDSQMSLTVRRRRSARIWFAGVAWRTCAPLCTLTVT